MDLENMAGYGGSLLQNAVKIVETWMLLSSSVILFARIVLINYLQESS